MRLARLLLLPVLAGCAADAAVPSGRLAFVSERDGNREVRVVDPASGTEVPLTTNAEADDYPAAVSPDGQRIAVVVSRTGEQGNVEELRIHAVAGGVPVQVGPRAALVRNPSWGPDGTWLVFEASSASFRDLYRVNADGTNLVRLTDNYEGNFEPAVSPDGRLVAFVSSRDGDAELYVASTDGTGEARRLTAFHRDDWGPQWAPDGRRLAFVSEREGTARVFVVNADGTGVRRLTADTARADVRETGPVWSPDGAWVAFVREYRGRPAEVRIRSADRTAEHGIALRASDVVRDSVAAPNGAQEAPAWSPDGQWIAFSWSHDGDADVWVARRDGSDARRVASAKGADWLPRWVR